MKSVIWASGEGGAFRVADLGICHFEDWRFWCIQSIHRVGI